MQSLNLVSRRFGATALSLLMLGSGTVPALAQGPIEGNAVLSPVVAATDGVVRTQEAAGTSTAQTSSAQGPRAVDTLPTDRVGVDKDKIVKLSLHDAILMALNNNIDIEVGRGNVQIAQYNLNGARGAYDPVLGSRINFNSSVTPTAQTFIGAQGGSYSSKQLDYNFNLRGAVNTAGTYSIDFNNSRQTNNAASAGLNPQYGTSLSFSFTQPLLRNYRFGQNERSILIGKKEASRSDSAFRQQAINTIARVQGAYWDLVYSVLNYKIARESVELADVTLRNNQRQVEVGTLAPIEIVSAKADLESRKDTAISALQQITIAENQLKALLLGDPSADMWSAQIEPTERVEFTPFDIDLNKAIETAYQSRPELEQMHIQQESKDIDLEFSRKQRKPQLDFVTSFRLDGLAGSTTSQSIPSSLNTGGLTASVDALNQQLGAFSPVYQRQGGGFGIAERFIGGYGTALKNLFGFDFHTYSFGVTFSFPLRNRTAEANYGRTTAERRQLQAQERQLRQNIGVEVRNAVQSVVSARQRVEAARAGRIAAEAQLKGEEQKYAAGISSNFFVLDRQTRLSTARGQEIRALTDYNKAISELQRVMSTTLSSNGVQVSSSASDQNPNTPATSTGSDDTKK